MENLEGPQLFMVCVSQYYVILFNGNIRKSVILPPPCVPSCDVLKRANSSFLFFLSVKKKKLSISRILF